MIVQAGGDATGPLPIPPSQYPGPGNIGLNLTPGQSLGTLHGISFIPGVMAAGVSGSVYVDEDDPSCGDATARRARLVSSNGAYFMNPNFTNVTLQQQKRTYVQRINCSSPEWERTGGICSPSDTCFLHEQVFTRQLSQAEYHAWVALNCCQTCKRPNTVPLGSDADGPYGHDIGCKPLPNGNCTLIDLTVPGDGDHS